MKRVVKLCLTCFALHKNKSQHIQKTMSHKKLLYLCNCYLFIGHKQVKLNNFCFDVLWDTFSVNCNSKLSRSTGSQGLAFGSRFSIEIIRFCTIQRIVLETIFFRIKTLIYLEIVGNKSHIKPIREVGVAKHPEMKPMIILQDGKN